MDSIEGRASHISKTIKYLWKKFYCLIESNDSEAAKAVLDKITIEERCLKALNQIK